MRAELSLSLALFLLGLSLTAAFYIRSTQPVQTWGKIRVWQKPYTVGQTYVTCGTIVLRFTSEKGLFNLYLLKGRAVKAYQENKTLKPFMKFINTSRVDVRVEASGYEPIMYLLEPSGPFEILYREAVYLREWGWLQLGVVLIVTGAALSIFAAKGRLAGG